MEITEECVQDVKLAGHYSYTLLQLGQMLLSFHYHRPFVAAVFFAAALSRLSSWITACVIGAAVLSILDSSPAIVGRWTYR